MPKYCCFNCPEKGHDDTRELDHKCPNCQFEYGFPLYSPPATVGKYKIEAPISRGFYGATYKVIDEVLGTEFVLKLIPKSIYELHNKDFYAESKDHAELAKGSQYIVGITGAEEHKVIFGNGEEVECYVQVLNYVPGKLLIKILESAKPISSIKITQISMDLFRILDVLRSKRKNHNDLHPENIIIEELTPENRRAGEIHSTTRAIAIDIGSLTSINKAGDSPDRQGDVHWVAGYLIKLSEKLLDDPDNVSDQDYRLASLLEDRAKLLFPAVEHTRAPNFDEIIEDIRNCFNQQTQPWEEPLKLLNFNDTYNAQTLDPWFVPSLLVDPEDQWLTRICGHGPLVITGMRGCGKTMMLRALQFHARATAAKLKFSGNKVEQLNKLREENYIGIYVSCNKLLDEIGKEADEALHEPFSRLFIRYGIEAIKAIRHLNHISEDKVRNDYFETFIEVYNQHVSNSEFLKEVTSERQLEQRLLSMIYSLNRGESNYVVTANPSNAFPALAQAIRKSSSLWTNHYILFLLDDVSTRYLGKENIKNLLSSLIFQSEECAFKITSEVQTVELLLYSPGKVEKAKKGRDFDTFDLGSAVNEKIRNRKKNGGKHFVADILNRRAFGNAKHPSVSPIEVLGDTTLASIAKSIATRGVNKTARKKIYHGISALAGVCVGDIGDIINLYDMIIKHYDNVKPIPPEKQNECFQDLCSVRLHEVNRRGSDYKDFALSFAKASHELLMQSNKDGSSRLRQYYSIYVRITTGNTEEQYEKIRRLLDAGIFVYSGGANAPRTLGNDTNPINQFKLTYRKLYGISNLIGLTQGDRFELSGEQLENWLNNPSEGKEILMKNVGGTSSNVDEGDDLDDTAMLETKKFEKVDSINEGVQGSLNFEEFEKIRYYDSKTVENLVLSKKPKSTEILFEDLESIKFDYLIAGLGFEDRTLESIRELIKLKPQKVLLVKYKEVGNTNEIIKLVEDEKLTYEIINYEVVKTSFDVSSGNVLCDITGLSKSLIFNIVRNTLKSNGKLWLSHVQASVYYPLNDEIDTSLKKIESEDNYSKLDIITKNVIKGEKGPYEIYDLLMSDTDESKRNVLIGFSNSKYERLFKILEKREFDMIRIVFPQVDSMRGQLARLASEVISNAYSNAECYGFESNDLDAMLAFLTEQYQLHYIDQNFNFELALTGSKRHTVACAAISAAFKISHCWYSKPSNWDIAKFSKGIGEKSYFKIEL
ncbi:ORC-CDC6 family AAA ATPase [Maribacter cobaltidurans]|uniref:Uncharacterized protein n=1 Tax=Maribacter cobaltidurans TaxID=1178778 RepID=A0A223VA34_9FLAO|nr:hypothetical protein [Maribacter cobaltidurans]ASV32245.1 hypothetical protein CJ263_19560 [Maribacter cobaltidurans]GGD90657.1 hypothetical protein GCM10011412_30690 [Maribacter cobaltidurans]